VYSNLALEEWLLTKLQGVTPRALLMYVNTPCVVIGRMQNPYKEANLKYLFDNNIHLARRRSGGGTVYQDLGNLNYSFVQSRDALDKKLHAKVICDALEKEFDVPVSSNDRGDVLLDGRKTSGCAQRITGTRSYHHGTLLVRSNLNELWKCISAPLSASTNARGSKSVRSAVANLSEFVPNVEMQQVMHALASHFITLPAPSSHKDVPNTFDVGRNNTDYPWIEISEKDVDNCEFYLKERNELAASKWRFGATFEFEQKIQFDSEFTELQINLKVEKGSERIQSCKAQCLKTTSFRQDERELVQKLIEKQWSGCKYSGSAMRSAITKKNLTYNHSIESTLAELGEYIERQIVDKWEDEEYRSEHNSLIFPEVSVV